MKSNILMLISMIIAVLIVFTVPQAQAVTVTATPNPAGIGQNVFISTTASFVNQIPPNGPCGISINFGDNTQIFSQTCNTNPCAVNTIHVYAGLGSYTITATASCSQNFNNNPIAPNPVSTTLAVQCLPLSITSPDTLPSGQVGQAYTYQLQTSGGQQPITFQLIRGSLPPGLTLSPTGLISGNPGAVGSHSFTVGATDSCQQTAQRTFNLNIQCTPLNITSPDTLPSGQVGQAYTYQLQTSGGQQPITFQLIRGSLPPGLTLSQGGLISGLPTSDGNFTFTVQATDSCHLGKQADNKTFSVNIQLPPITISVIPSSFNVPRGRSSMAQVTYLFSTGTSSYKTTLQSQSGNFIVENEIIEVNPGSLTANIQNGSGTVSEVIHIPVRVIERSLQRGSTRFSYVRSFNNQSVTLTASVAFTITTEAAADFEITRIELYFENKRPEITVARNYPDLKAFANIRFVGFGLLQGYWEVDERILSYVNQHLTFAQNAVIQTPDIPPLPTFEAGTHSVRFVLTNPVQQINIPSMVYYVTPEEFQEAAVSINLFLPEQDALHQYSPVIFKWEKLNKTAVYLIQYYDNTESTPIFSALSKEASYTLTDRVIRNIFSPGKRYSWKVTGFDEDSKIIGESSFRKFIFKDLESPQSHRIPGFQESPYSVISTIEASNTYHSES
jgi:hypothetical protein